MDRLRNKRLFITPYSPIARKLEKYLIKDYEIISLGFIDKSKVDDNVSKIDVLDIISFDFIVIFSPNHFKDIYKQCMSKTSKNKIIKIDFFKNNYFILNENRIFLENIKNIFFNKVDYFIKIGLQKFCKLIDFFKIKRELYVFISEDYVDANIKHSYLYYLSMNQKVLLLTNNENQIHELRKKILPVERLYSIKAYIKTAFAKVIFLDHFIIDYLEYTSTEQLKVQLWHGVGLKPIRDRSHFEYDYFISTSIWTNETNFKNVFKAKNFINSGYPRNDILLKEKIDKNDLIFCDMDIYNQILDDKKNNLKILLYMPTFREDGFDTFPLDFDSFNEKLKNIRAKFYVKLHPYVLNQYLNSIENVKKYSNIVFYNTQGDIYPILKNIDILITDYSSIAYDFMLLDRPIIFFNYDYDEYIKVREESIGDKFLFDFYEFSPGDKVKTQEELVYSILKNNNDEYINERENIRGKFFDYNDSNSRKRLHKLLTTNQ
jgi:CDP-glycerol glycerophosphotransferase (TagB/SpsB family)